MDKYAVIVAGGSGVRMGSTIPKQFLMLQNKPIVWHTLTAFLNAFEDLKIILVLPEPFLQDGNDIINSTPAPERIKMITGGNSRFHSVQNGLNHVPENCIVFVHDGVRCLVSKDLIRKCYEATIEMGNAIPAVPAVDTIRIETASGSEMVERSKVKVIQTPQTFFSSSLKQAYQQDHHESFTDDASVLESMGEKVHLVEGEVTNIKITRKIDLLIAEQVLIDRSQP